MANNKSFIAKNGVSTGDGYNMPKIRPSLLLDFENSKVLDPRVSFTRTGSALYYDGYSHHKSEENLIGYSNFTTGWTNTNYNVTQAAATAPDGTTTAVRASPTSAAANNSVALSSNVGNDGDTVTWSVYAKQDSTDYPAISVYFNSASSARATFDLTNGTVVGTTNGTGTVTASIVDANNGWYRCIVTFSGATTTACTVYVLDSANHNDFVLGNSPDGSKGMFLWGPQIQKRSSATAYTATTGSPIQKFGPTLKTASSNIPRFDHDPLTRESKGLLIEYSRTNLCYPSVLGSTWAHASNMIHQNYAIAPDGTHTAAMVYESVTSRQQLVYVNVNTVTSGADYIFSFYVKPYTYDGSIEIHSHGDSSSSFNIGGADFAATDGSKGMYSVGNDWKRIWWRRTKSNTTGTIYIGFSASTYAGDGYEKGFLCWGGDLQQGSIPTSHIPTTTANVTRGAEDAFIDNVDTSDWFNASEGTSYVEAAIGGFVTSQGFASFYQEDEGNDWTGFYSNAPTNNQAHYTATAYEGSYTASGGSNTGAVGDQERYDPGEFIKMSLGWSNSRGTATFDGEASSNTGTYRVIPYTVLNFSQLYQSGFPAYQVHIKKYAFYPECLPEDEAAALTEK